MRKLILIIVLALLGFGLTAQNRTMRGNLSITDTLRAGYFDDGSGRFESDTAHIVWISNAGDDVTGDGSEGNPYESTKRAVESLNSYRFIGSGGRAIFYYTAGSYLTKDVFPYLQLLDTYFGSKIIIGEVTVGDTINVTHPGTGVQSYFRFNTDSTIVGDKSRTILARAKTALGYYAGSPIVENTSSTFVTPGASFTAGTNRYFIELETDFVSTGDFLICENTSFYNIEFHQSKEGDSYNFKNSSNMWIIGCIFRADYPTYDVVDINGPSCYLYNSILEHTSNASSGDVLEVGQHAITITGNYLYSSNAQAMGSQGLEVRPGSSNIDFYNNVLNGFDEAIKNDGNSMISIGSILCQNSTTLFHFHDPRKQFVSETENIWLAGHDSIICENVTYLFNFNNTYDAGRDVLLPHLKAGGYTTFDAAGVLENGVMDLENMYMLTVGTQGIHKLKVDTIEVGYFDGTGGSSTSDTVTADFFQGGNAGLDTLWAVEIYEDITIDASGQDSSIYISKTGSDVTGDGTVGNPVATFQRASELTPDYKSNADDFWIGLGSQMFYWFGPGEWYWKDIQPYLTDMPARFLGEFPVVVDQMEITRVSDTSYYANITQPAFGDDTYKGYRGGFAPIVEHHGDTLIMVDRDPNVGSIDIKAPPATIFNMEGENMGTKNKVFSFINWQNTSTETMNFRHASSLAFVVCDFNLPDRIWTWEAASLRFESCIFNLEEQIYTGQQTGSVIFEACYFRNVGGGSQDINGVGCYGNATDFVGISGVFENFANSIHSDMGMRLQFNEAVYFIDCYNALDIAEITTGFNIVKCMDPFMVRNVTIPFDIGAYIMGYNVEIDNYITLGPPPTTLANVPVNLWDLSTDQYLFINKDTARVDLSYAGKLESRVVDTIDLTVNPTWQQNSKNLLITPSSSKPNNIYAKNDTLLLEYGTKLFNYENNVVNINTVDSIYGLVYLNTNEIKVNNFHAQRTFATHTQDLLLYPEENDTIRLATKEGFKTAVEKSQLQTYTPESNSRVELGDVVMKDIYAALDDDTSVDSITGISFRFRDAGIVPDSIGKVFMIKNIDEGDALRGADNTYFLYSEYGDNYLKGDLEVTGDIQAKSIHFDSIRTSYNLLTLYISNSGSDETGDGSESNPFQTTHKAVVSLKDTIRTNNITFSYDVGDYNMNNIIPYIAQLSEKLQIGINLTGQMVPIDTINLTHPGGAVQSYFRFHTDSIRTDSVKARYFVARKHPVTGLLFSAYPLAEINGNEVMLPGDSFITGDTIPIVELGTRFFLDTTIRVTDLRNITFSNIHFDEGSHYISMSNSNAISFSSCKFNSSSFTCLSISGNQNYVRKCVFANSGANEDAMTASGDTEVWNSLFYNSYGPADLGYYGVSCYFGRINVEKNWFENWDNALRIYEYNLLLSGNYIKNSTTAVRFHEPQHTLCTEASATYIAGHDSIICENVTNFFEFNISYHAGRFVFLPNMLVSGYTNYSSNPAFQNHTLNLETTNWSAMDGGVKTLKVDTVQSSKIMADTVTTTVFNYEPPHAKMTFEGESETLTMSDDVWVKFTNATDDLFSSTDASNITQAGDSLTIIIAGDYMVNASISFSGTTNTDLYEFAIFVNDVKASIAIPRTTTSTDIGNVSLPIYLDGLQAGDDVCLKIRNTANDFDATLIACSWITTLLHTE